MARPRERRDATEEVKLICGTIISVPAAASSCIALQFCGRRILASPSWHLADVFVERLPVEIMKAPGESYLWQVMVRRMQSKDGSRVRGSVVRARLGGLRASQTSEPGPEPASRPGFGLGPGFVGAAEYRNWYFENDISKLH